MLNYIVLKTLFYENNDNSTNTPNATKDDKNDLLNISNTLHESHDYIRNLEELLINDKNIYISCTSNHIPTIKDVDGLFLVNNSDSITSYSNKYYIYNKNTIELKGYIYNTVDIQIKKVGLIEILSIQSNLKPLEYEKPIKLNKKKSIKNNPKKNQNRNKLNFELIKELKDKLKNLQEKKTK